MTQERQEKYIAACLDGCSLSEAVCQYSIWLALKLDLPLKFLHVIEHGQFLETSDFSGAIGLGARKDLLDELSSLEESRSKLLLQQGKIILETAEKNALAAGVSKVSTAQSHGTLVDRLVEIELEIHTAVIGIRGVSHENDQTALGAQLEALVHSIHRPILVVNQEFQEPKTFMLAYDASEAAERALNLVCSTPGFKDDAWIVVHAHPENKNDTALQKAEIQLNDHGFANVVLESKVDRPEHALVECQNFHNVDVTVMGAYSHHPLRGFIFGSFTEKMLRFTRKPLLLIH